MLHGWRSKAGPAKAGPATAVCGAQVLTKEAKSAREEHDRVTLHVDTEPLLQEDCAQYGGARRRERERQAAGRAGRRSAVMWPATAGETASLPLCCADAMGEKSVVSRRRVRRSRWRTPEREAGQREGAPPHAHRPRPRRPVLYSSRLRRALWQALWQACRRWARPLPHVWRRQPRPPRPPRSHTPHRPPLSSGTNGSACCAPAPPLVAASPSGARARTDRQGTGHGTPSSTLAKTLRSDPALGETTTLGTASCRCDSASGGIWLQMHGLSVQARHAPWRRHLFSIDVTASPTCIACRSARGTPKAASWSREAVEAAMDAMRASNRLRGDDKSSLMSSSPEAPFDVGALTLTARQCERCSLALRALPRCACPIP
jgi:hypothetical protein